MVNPVRFFLVLLLALLLAFAIHLAILHLTGFPLWENLIVLSYALNYLMAGAIFYMLYHFRKRFANAMGFLFMGGSVFKFVVFFLVFYPVFKRDGDVSNLEFAAFFIPYLISLIIETFFSSKMLNTMKNDKV